MTTTLTFSPPTTGADAGPTPSGRLRRAGALAALVAAATYLIGLGLMGAYLVPAGFGDGGPADELAFLLDHRTTLYAFYLVLYLVGGVALAVLAVALHDRLRSAPTGLRPVAGALGLIWSGLLLATGMIALVGQRAVADLAATDPDRAATILSALSAVQDGLGGGIELVGGLWVLLVCLAARPHGLLGRRTCALGVVVGAAGILTVVPALEVLAVVFGLGFIAWFVATGLALARRPVADAGAAGS